MHYTSQTAEHAEQGRAREYLFAEGWEHPLVSSVRGKFPQGERVESACFTTDMVPERHGWWAARFVGKMCEPP